VRGAGANAWIVAAASLLLAVCSVSAVGGTGMMITINNNSTSDLLVTAYDLNAGAAQKVLSNEKINSFASIAVPINTDESGYGHLSWSATSVSRDSPMCGRSDAAALSDSDTVHVYADAACKSP
jgi:hypothetical protein